MLHNRIIYFPRTIALCFLVFSEVLLLIGPFSYQISNYFLLYSYLVILNFAFYYGYQKGVRHFKPSEFKMRKDVIAFILIVGFLLTIRRLSSMWAGRGLAVTLYNLVYALQNPGTVYLESVSLEGSVLTYLWLILEPVRWAAIPLGIANWKRFKYWIKAIVIATVLLEIIMWLGIGTRKGIFDVIIISFFLIIAKTPKLITVKSERRKVLPIIVIAIVLFLGYFTISGASRKGYEMNEISSTIITQDIKPGYRDLPDWALFSLCSIESYLCQGYYALSKGLEIGVKPLTFGGSGWFTIMLMRKIGYDPEPYTYMASLESFGIDRSVNWHTMYLWLANDVSFFGVPFLVFIIGFLFARSWLDVVEERNQASYPFFALMLIMVFYFYANNQVLSFSFMPFVFWLIFYLFTRSKRIS